MQLFWDPDMSKLLTQTLYQAEGDPALYVDEAMTVQVNTISVGKYIFKFDTHFYPLPSTLSTLCIMWALNGNVYVKAPYQVLLKCWYR